MEKEKVIFIKSEKCVHGHGVSYLTHQIDQGMAVSLIVGDGQGGFLVLLIPR